MNKTRSMFAWLGKFWWILLLALVLVCMVIGALCMENGLPVPYKKTFDGYLLAFDLQDTYDYSNPKPVPLYAEPVHMELDGYIYHSFTDRSQYHGAIRLDGYTLMRYYVFRDGRYAVEHETRPATEAENKQAFALYDKKTDGTDGYYQDTIRSTDGVVYLENEKGERPWFIFTLPEKDKYCLLVSLGNDPDTGVSRQGYMVFPSDTPEEALEIFTNEHLATWRETITTNTAS